MNGKLQLALRILFIVVLIWFLAAVSGVVPGVRLRIGNSGGGRCRRRRSAALRPGRDRRRRIVGRQSLAELHACGDQRSEFLGTHDP